MSTKTCELHHFQPEYMLAQVQYRGKTPKRAIFQRPEQAHPTYGSATKKDYPFRTPYLVADAVIRLIFHMLVSKWLRNRDALGSGLLAPPLARPPGDGLTTGKRRLS